MILDADLELIQRIVESKLGGMIFGDECEVMEDAEVVPGKTTLVKVSLLSHEDEDIATGARIPFPVVAKAGPLFGGPGWGFYAPIKKGQKWLVFNPAGNIMGDFHLVKPIDNPLDPPPEGWANQEILFHADAGVNVHFKVSGGGKIQLGDDGKGVGRIGDAIGGYTGAPIGVAPPHIHPLGAPSVPPPNPADWGVPPMPPANGTGEIAAGSAVVEAQG